MRKIILRVKDRPVNGEESLMRGVQELELKLKEVGRDYDGILVSVKTGRAYVYKEEGVKNAKQNSL